ncbi:MlaD family protein [Fluviibacterium sp. DFM31]|uniref:MlaD family protein n=1 Tax=Meridianimarinicoccus marinus TaxID=3231483 RepID=A0ABV3LDA3_9RHOB
MSQKTNPKLVGIFVLGAFAVAMGGLVAFGGAGFLIKKQTFVMFFQGSVAGLQVGAPVNFRGVPLGQVTDISVSYFPKDEDSEFVIPVYVQIEPDRIRGRTDENRRSINDLIEFGLRAELALQSFVTGQLGIELDFKSGSKATLTGLDPDHEEIPTLPSDTEKLKASITRVADILQEVPLEEVAEDIQKAVKSASGSIVRVSSAINEISDRIGPFIDELHATITDVRATAAEAKARLSMQPGEVLYSAEQTMTHLQTLIDGLDDRITPISQELQATLAALQKTAQDASALIENVQGEVAPISDGLQQTLATANGTLEDTRAVVTSLDAKADPLLADARTALATAAEVLDEVRAPIGSVGRLAAELETEVGPIANEATATMEAARTALQDGVTAIDDLRKLIANVDGGVQPIIAKIDGILDTADLAMRDARSAMSGVRSLVGADSPTVTQLDVTLREIRRAAMSLREFADYLERNPSALLTGRR